MAKCAACLSKNCRLLLQACDCHCHKPRPLCDACRIHCRKRCRCECHDNAAKQLVKEYAQSRTEQTEARPFDDLSSRQLRMLDYIETYIMREHRAPAVREIAEACEISSTSVAAYNLQMLKQRGYIKLGEKGDQRAIVVLRGRHSFAIETPGGIYATLPGNPLEYGQDFSTEELAREIDDLIRRHRK